MQVRERSCDHRALVSSAYLATDGKLERFNRILLDEMGLPPTLDLRTIPSPSP
jgi:hypothetical protein